MRFRNLLVAALGVATLGLLGVVSTAEGTTYSHSYDWDVVRTSDVPPSVGSEHRVVSELELGRCRSGTSITCPVEGTTAAVTPTFPKIDCVMGPNGIVYARFLSDADDMPSSWPSTVSCSYNLGGHTFTANISLHPQSTETWDKVDTLAWVPGDGVVFDFDPIVTGSHTVSVAASRAYPLPPTPSYVSEVVNAVKGGSTWTGVRCEIIETGATTGSFDFLSVFVSETAVAGTGACTIQRTGQSNASVAITIDRA